MHTNNGKEHYIPSREIAYAYTAAMHFGQLLELNLRAILYTADYHGWGTQFDLDETESKRFKDTETFIDAATCGHIIQKLRATGIIKDNRAWKVFERACAHRNTLAHSFLAEYDFTGMTKQREKDIIFRLHDMTFDLYRALLMSRAVRERVEYLADQADKAMSELFMDAPGTPYCWDPNRHYATRKRKKKSSGKAG